MRMEKQAYSQVCVGPGGRTCICCSAPPRIQKRLDHKAARRHARTQIHNELFEAHFTHGGNDNDHGT